MQTNQKADQPRITQKQLDAYAAGEVELKELLAISPEYLAQLKGRAQFFLDGGHRQRALMMLEMLEELDRTDPLPTLLAIEVLLQLGQSDTAEQKIHRLLALRPNDPQALVALAELKLAIGEMVPAADLLKKVIETDAQAKTPAGARARAVAARAATQLQHELGR
jgi:Flp pilus assembly protein TadD